MRSTLAKGRGDPSPGTWQTEAVDGELTRLAARVAALERRLELGREADEAVERAMTERRPVASLLGSLLPLLVEATGAVRGFAEVLGEPGVHWPRPERTDPESAPVIRTLEVGGRALGRAGVWLPVGGDREPVEALLEVWCEVLDDHLAMVALAQEKHEVSRAVSRALADPVLGDGLDAALGALARFVRFDDLVVVFRPGDGEGPLERRWLCRAPDRSIIDRRDDPALAALAPEVLSGGLARWLEQVDAGCSRQEALLIGARDQAPVGRLVVSRRSGGGGEGSRDFDAAERDLVQVLADHLRQRLVDFSREHAQLSTCFPPGVVARLLAERGYRDRYLTPREVQAAILFADLSGFTRISEVLLPSPAAVGALVDAWAAAAVDAIWEAGGVFDKMVGDCIIALFGPPFCEWSGSEAAERALATAESIRARTRALPRDPRHAELAGLDGVLGVATGLHLAPLCVGLFGPNANYTGFSAGMNNAARLQALAAKDEILAMDAFVAALPARDRFGPVREARVKNVADPIRFRALLGP